MTENLKEPVVVLIMKLIRWPNLMIIAVAMTLAQYTIINPLLQYNELPLMRPLVFILLTLSTVFIAAGGYVINDILDVKIDLINKANKVIVGRKYALNLCWELYWACTVTGVIFMLVACWYNKTIYLAVIAAFEAALLWFYSSLLKRLPIIGNVCVSILCGLAILKPLLFHAPAYPVGSITFLIFGYVLFAFVLTLIRELVKTCQDVAGDLANGAQTAAVLFGVTTTKYIASFFIVIVAYGVGWFMWMQWQSETFWTHDFISFCYLAIFVQAPMLLLLYITVSAKTIKQFGLASTLTKTIMVTGIFSMAVFYWVLF